MRAPTFTPPPGRRARWLLVALCCGALGAPPARAGGTGQLRLFAITAGGYDDDILGRSAASASRADVTLAAGFAQGSPVADFRLTRGAWEMTGSYAFLYNRFFKPEAGGYRDHAGELELRCRPDPHLLLAASGNLESFRRTRFNEYDLNHAEGTFRAEVTPDPRVTLRGALSLQRDHYPHSRVDVLVRPPALVDTVDQLDEPTNFELSATLRPLRWATLETGWVRLRTDSNVARFGYDGQQVFAGISLATRRGGALGFSWVYETRDYDTFGPLAARRDHSATWQVEARQRVIDRLTAFCAGSRLDYHSNADGYSFDQSRVRAGLEIRLSRAGTAAGALAESGSTRALLSAVLAADSLAAPTAAGNLSPRIRPGAVLFRCRAPGATRVALAGSFNGWSKVATPLADPDHDGLWEATLPLEPGTYRYMFYIDNAQWAKPEAAPLYEDDGFGLINGVLVVP